MNTGLTEGNQRWGMNLARDLQIPQSEDTLAQLGSGLKEWVNPKYHILGDLFNLIPLKETPEALFYFLHFTWVNEIFLGPDITSRNS